MDLKILEIASDNKNQKIIKNHTHCSKLKNSICGDEIQIKLMIKQNKIIDFGYQGESCIYCQATASLLSKILINSDKTKIKELCTDADSYFQGNFKIIKKRWSLLDKLFKQKNLARKECILLPFKTLKKIISN
tara:strand:+ start:1511 stop:1909 length:399 start_codon:yes stop_codon:yes gene_type:complete